MTTSANATAWAFLVVSDPAQRDTLPDQKAWALEAAAKNGWAITKIVSGVSSGKLGARRLTVAMIDELEALRAQSRPKRLLMIRLERFGRGDGLEAMEAFLRIRKLGIVVHTRVDGDVGYDRASDLLMPVLRFFIGGMENEVKRDKLLSFYARRREAHVKDPSVAISMRPPYGLAYKDGHVVPQEPEATAVRLAYELKGQGYGCHLVGKRMAQFAPPMVMKNGDERPQKWNGDRVRRLLIKETYRGIVVDEVTWLRAQRHAREIARPQRRFEYSLGGALRCHCGAALIGQTSRRHGEPRHQYYLCTNLRGHAGHMRSYRSVPLEAQFVDLIGSLAADPALLAAYVDSKDSDSEESAGEAQLTALKREYGEIDERRRAIFVAYEDETLSREDLQWRLEDLRHRKTTLEKRIDELERELRTVRVRRLRLEDVAVLVASAKTTWLAASNDDRRALAKALSRAFGGFVVNDDGSLHTKSEVRGAA